MNIRVSPFMRVVSQTSSIAFAVVLVLGVMVNAVASASSLPAPVVTSAPDGQTYSLAPSLFWEPVNGAGDYIVEIASEANFTTVVHRDRTPLGRYVKGSAMEPGVYYWRVAAVPEPIATAEEVAAAVASGRMNWSHVSRLEVLRPENVFEVPADADMAELNAILRSAVRQSPARVVFAKDAVYRFHPEMDLIYLRDASNLDIDGNGARIVLTNSIATLATFVECERITLRNLTVEHDPAPFTVASITKVDANRGRVDVQMDSGMLPLDSALVQKHWTWGVVLDGNTPGRMKAGSPIIVSTSKEKLQRTGENTFTMQLDDLANARYFAPGDKWVQFVRNNGGRELVIAASCNEMAFINITNHTTAGGHYIILNGGDSKVLGCHSLIKEGRWMGGNADGIHARSNNIGVWVEGCTFEGLGDDGTALYSKGIAILGKPSPNELLLGDEFFNLKTGSEAMIFNPVAGRLVGEALTVKSVSRREPSGGLPLHWLVTFDQAMTGDIPLGEKEEWKNAQVFDRSNQHANFMLRRNTFKQIRRYGAIVRAIGGAIEENDFINVSDSAIMLRNEPLHWRNGLHSSDIVIQRNTIIDSNFSTGSIGQGAIHIKLYALGQQWQTIGSNWKGHSNIAIRDNTIRQWHQRGISVENALGVTITGNRLIEPLDTPVGWPTSTPIYLRHVDGGVVTGNTISGTGKRGSGIDVNDSLNVRVSGNRID